MGDKMKKLKHNTCNKYTVIFAKTLVYEYHMENSLK